MAVDKRVVAVLDAIVNDPGITGTKLEERFRLTRKQLSYTLQKVNDYLESNHFDRISRLKTGKLHISRHVIEHFRQHQTAEARNRYLFSEEERGQMVVFMLLTRSERLSLLHLSSSLGVSQNTIINDLKKVRAEAARFGLEISYDRGNGYHILGEELEKRYLLLNCLRRVLEIPVAKSIISQYNNVMSEHLEKVGNVFSEIERRFKIQFTDRQLQELIYFICFILHRIACGKYLVNLPESYADIASSRDFSLIQSVISKIDIHIQNELIFLTALIQSSNIQSIADKYFHLDAILLESVCAVVDSFEKISCVTIKEKSELIEKIYQHWKPAYYRIRYHLANTSSVYELVVKEFSHLHEMVRRAAAPFEQLVHCEIPDEEMAFLTVLFGGWLTREGVIHQVKLQKTALVVCENSATISTYLFLTLQVLFPELYFSSVMSRREFERYSGHYDVVFSTTHLSTSKMVFVVNPSASSIHKSTFRHHVIGALQGVDPNIIQIEQLLLIFERFGNITDHKGLQRALAHYIYDENHAACPQNSVEPAAPSLAELLGETHVRLAAELPASWQEAISDASSSLLRDAVIEPRYVRIMTDKISEEQPWIMLAEGVIIAHAGIDDGAADTGMALLRLPEKMDFAGYMQADIVIVLATHNPQKHLKALAQLNEFLEFHDGGNCIRQARNKTELLNAIAIHR
ncbi:BglG family transcription antiterminator [[Enterobacter] lignolyticus]|uniref:Ascorbate-specific PTS system EIIA component n=1 Tax=[Enterobacter] lignolyticus TaxID=1334193 RepID=A0A806X8F9_9ENTR|nr:BglG family transcription antiterminator [[Enterobacter] lignolyticus]ALR74871.1 transcription antiterminator BglG [[Enterobacter] lignolyticus]